MATSENIVWHSTSVTKKDRQKASGERSAIIWFTGLSGSGKSTLANAVEVELFKRNVKTYLLDGDNIRSGLNKNLGFSEADRKENIRRIGEVAKLFVDSNTIVLTAFISPFIEDRETVRQLVEEGEFIEIYVKASLEACEGRDPKGLYKKARAGQIKDFTGIDSPYEAPEHPDLVVDTEKETIEESTAKIVAFLKEQGIIE
ncbi:adenylyl-sulfate kinase [Pullulanibacillus sp. KACC 23026]|uniref:adenylyl-sulfate kinase n=1 Tax=Pullulanibacillus sp. KACC 23026 TaxID=3028315 RepID=UPI0023AF2F10|nr:adenylyl-sulfate kinase [Pullulanibacillus sp. KACC 23026]WEG12990.1 adenylyl-sulfate kinase [Pullulanibacillus sp. KACC 23026]